MSGIDKNSSGSQETGKLRETILALSLAMAGTSILVCSVVGGMIHLYATALAFKASGLGAALLTLFFPFFAELYWIIVVWFETGVFWHGLTIASAGYFALIVMTVIAGVAAAWMPDREDP